MGGGIAAAQGTQPPGVPKLDWIERYVLVTDQNASATARQPTQGQGSPTGPAYFTGSFYNDADAGPSGLKSGAAPVGRFRISAWVYGGGLAPQLVGLGSFDFFGKGKVTVVGASGPVGSLAVSGGTGVFAGVGGEARLANLTPGNAMTLIVEFNFIGESTGR
jgi:hypothetical protein